MEKIIFRIIIVLFLLFVYIFVCADSYVMSVSKNISDSVFRLHVIANSNSYEDQNLKYLVRDNIIEYMNNYIDINTSSKDEIVEIAQSHIDDIQNIAQKTVYDNGYNYTVNTEIGNYQFPTKQYGDISFPAGYYDALRISIGEANGQNWWCVMFPPLCFIDVTSGVVPDGSKEQLEKTLDDEEYDLVAEDSPDINFKFKIIEIFSDLGFNN